MTIDHELARGRHEERLTRGLAASAARQDGVRRARLSREHCPLSLLAAWIVSRRRAAAGRPATAR